MPSRIESFELRNSRDKHEPHNEALPPPYTPYAEGISRSSLFLGLYIVVPGLIIVSAIVLGFKSAAAATNMADAPPGQWLDQKGVKMEQWPSTLFPNQDELPLAVAALALVTALVAGGLVLLVVRRGPLLVSFSKRLAILVHVGLTAALALAATIYTFALNNKSTGFDLTWAVSAAPKSPGTFIYNQGRFSKEVWACTVTGLPHFNTDIGGAMTTACGLETASRWLTLFTFLLSVALFSLLYLDSRGGRSFMRS